jgi:hypothetical protein
VNGAIVETASKPESSSFVGKGARVDLENRDLVQAEYMAAEMDYYYAFAIPYHMHKFHYFEPDMVLVEPEPIVVVETPVQVAKIDCYFELVNKELQALVHIGSSCLVEVGIGHTHCGQVDDNSCSKTASSPEMDT